MLPYEAGAVGVLMRAVIFVLLSGCVQDYGVQPHEEENEAPIEEVDTEKRNEITREMQRQEYEEGGNIISYFQNLIDGHAAYVKGAVARPNLLNFDHFGRGWKNIWLDL